VSGGRAARQGFQYYAFDGWEIARADPRLSSETLQDLVRAEAAVRDADTVVIEQPSLARMEEVYL